MANSLPGCPIVGFYNEATGDFEEHNKQINISNGKITVSDTTFPYGFVDMNPKVWFQKFVDDGEIEREYLVTEGYIWTEQFPESKRIITNGNNQSMELDQKTLNGTWSKDNKGKPQFFIINEAIISKLCVLGENVEPCFEGSQITGIQFALEDDFKDKLLFMANELKEILSEGGTSSMHVFAVEIGDALWCSFYDYLEKTYPRVSPDGSECYGSMYSIEGLYEENSEKFAILKNRSNNKFYKMAFSLSEANGITVSGDLVEVTKTYKEVSQFSLEAVEEFETNRYAEFAKKSGQDSSKKDDESSKNNDEKDNKSDDGKKKDDEEFKKKQCYSLEEIPEYVELNEKYSALETTYSQLKADYENLQAEVQTLTQFKNSVDKKAKEDMIASFYMLSDDDKADVIANIDTYSLDDIEAKLSIICVRNKVNFNLEEDDKSQEGNTSSVTFNLNSGAEDDGAPAWLKAVRENAKNMR